MKTISDNHLMNKVKAGHINFMGLLYERYKRTLLGFFYNQLNDKSRSEDLLQTTFLRALKYRQSFDPNKNFKTWIFTIARNALRDDFRKNGQQQEFPWRESDDRPSEESTVDPRTLTFENQDYLKELLGKLSPEKVEILTLVKLNNKKYGEVAAIVNKKESTVKSIVFRALRELQEHIKKSNWYP